LCDGKEDHKQVGRLNERGKLVLLCLLLLLTLGLLAFAVMQTVQQVRSFQQRSHAVKAGDVSTVRPWMTVHAVSHIYHVPESYLNQELGVRDPNAVRHVTLNTIAKTSHKPVNTVIQTVQHAIVKYRQAHPHSFTPSPTPSIINRKALSTQVERWQA